MKIPNPKKIHTLILDFDGVFTDNKVFLDEAGKESVSCSRGDGFSFNLLRAYQKQKKINIDMFILSTEPNKVVLHRAKKLKIKCYHGQKDKLAFVKKYLEKKSRSPSGVIFLCNDLNDYSLMKYVGFSVSPNDAHQIIKKTACLVLPQNGGSNFIRSFVENWIGLNKMQEEELNELISYC